MASTKRRMEADAPMEEDDAFVYVFDRRDKDAPDVKIPTGGLFSFDDFKERVREVSLNRKQQCLQMKPSCMHADRHARDSLVALNMQKFLRMTHCSDHEQEIIYYVNINYFLKQLCSPHIENAMCVQLLQLVKFQVNWSFNIV